MQPSIVVLTDSSPAAERARACAAVLAAPLGVETRLAPVYPTPPMPQLVLLRHGQSVWNQENRFTGWTDVALSAEGVRQAAHAGRLLQQRGFAFDVGFTSVLQRAIRTLAIVLEELGLGGIPVEQSWRLNERNYGALQGLNKAETAAKYGEAQVQRWRRDPHAHPPALTREDPRFPGHDARYHELTAAELPLTENLRETMTRVLPCWEGPIRAALRANRKVIVCAHGNSLRALVQHLDHLPDAQVMALEIPLAVPLVYELDAVGNSRRHYYLE